MKIYAVQFHNGDQDEWEEISILKYFLNKQSAENFRMSEMIKDPNWVRFHAIDPDTLYGYTVVEINVETK